MNPLRAGHYKTAKPAIDANGRLCRQIPSCDLTPPRPTNVKGSVTSGELDLRL